MPDPPALALLSGGASESFGVCRSTSLPFSGLGSRDLERAVAVLPLLTVDLPLLVLWRAGFKLVSKRAAASQTALGAGPSGALPLSARDAVRLAL